MSSRSLSSAVLAGLFALAAVWACPARAGAIADQVLKIEAQYGSQPPEVIARLRPIEADARAGDADDIRVFLAAWGYAHAAVDKPAVADAAVEELTALGERSHDAATLASAYALKACTLEFAGQMRTAFGWVETALPYTRAASSPDLHYWVYMTAAELATSNGQLEEAVRLYEDAAIAARETGNLRREAQAHLSLAPLRIVRGQIPAAFREAAEVRTLAARASWPWLVVAGWVMEAQVAEAQGDSSRVARAVLAAQAAQREVPPPAPSELVSNAHAGSDGWMNTQLEAMQELSRLHLSAGNFTAARDLAVRARLQARDQHDATNEALATINMGLAELGLGQVEAGMRDANAGLSTLSPKRNAELLIQLNRYIAALERRGETSESWNRMREALLLETELARRDRQSTVIALQRESSFLQRQRQVEQLQHVNELQAAEIQRRSIERTLSWLFGAAMALAGFIVWRLYRRTRESNRQLAETNQTLAYASTHDTITGLYNRRAMEFDTQALQGVAFCSVSLSIKQFGLIVGNVGHDQGDVLLCQIANRLNVEAEKYEGRLYRVDGVNFTVIYRFGNDRERLDAAVQALMGAMELPFELGNQDLLVHLGVGAAEYPKHGDTPQETARMAELARLQAFGEPGNTYVVYEPAIGEGQRDKLQMEARMLRALAQGDFELYYQGQRGMREGRFTGFEALLRWHDDGRMVSPAEFIPVAEETGLIVKIGAWVLRSACLQAKAWAEAGFGDTKVAVNISPRQFAHPDFLATVRETLRETGVDPAQIELEITEGSVMNDAEASVVQLHALRQLGLQLAIDDFGTGYASLSYLRRFPLDQLKIDRSFIKRLGGSTGDDTIVRTVIELAHSLGLSVTAEGVETTEQEEMLHSWGCDVVQGFLHSKPGPAAGATELLRKQQHDAPEPALQAV
jgi:diguanylate cyclase (GGDEF)-like protein